VFEQVSGGLLVRASDESVNPLGLLDITVGKSDATQGDFLLFRRTHGVFPFVMCCAPMGQAAWDGVLASAARSTPLCSASLRTSGIRQSGISPLLENFQLDTVEGVRFSAVATLEVPPSAAMMVEAFCIPDSYDNRNLIASG
jgi:hypothetical protein